MHLMYSWAAPATLAAASRVAPAPRPSTGTLRLVVLPLLVGIASLGLSDPLARRGPPIAPLALQWMLFALWGWWAHRTARTLAVPVAGLLAPPADRRAWRHLWLVVPLLPFCLSALLVQMGLVVRVVPGAERWLLAAEPADAAPPLVVAALTALTGATLVALVEETVFRGVLLRAWSARFGTRRALVGTAVVFGLLHHDPIGSVVFGLVLGVVALRTGSIAVPAAMHGLYNAATGVALFGDGGDPLTGAQLHAFLLPAALALSVSLLTIVVLLRLLAPRTPATSAGRVAT